MATTITKVIDPDSGAGFDYSSLSSWESGEAADITAATGSDEVHIAKCRCTGGTADTTGVVISNTWVTAPANYIKIWTDPAESYRHNGTYQTGNKYRLEPSSGARVIQNTSTGAHHILYMGLQLKPLDITWSYGIINSVSATGAWCYVEHSIVKGNGGTSDNQRGIYLAGWNCSRYIQNCLVYDVTSTTAGAGQAYNLPDGSAVGVYVYNCTAVDCEVGFYSSADITHFNNCLAKGNTTDFDGGHATGSQYNASEDGSHPGGNGQTGAAIFWDEAADDFHLSHEDTVARTNGIDLYGDGDYAQVFGDIDMETRVDWDIGADESPTDVVKIIDPDSGGGFDYTTLSAWEAGQDADIVAAHQIQIAKCRCTGGTSDKSIVTPSATWATDERHFVKIWTDPAESYRHDGVWATGNKYRLECTGTCFGNLNLDHVKLIGLQIQLTRTGGSKNIIYSGAGSTGWCYIEKCILKGALSASTGTCYGIKHDTTGDLFVSNNVIFDLDLGTPTDHAGIYCGGGSGANIFLYNNTIQGCDRGYESTANPNIRIKNCIGQSCDTCFSSSNWDTASHNCSDDSSEPGTSGRTGPATFEDEGADDFHLADADTVCRGYGIDLSADTDYPITDDIDDDTRSYWDIGADENLSAGVIHEGSATASGSGSSSPDGRVIRGGSATASGIGSSSPDGSVIRAGSATASGAGSSSPDGRVIRGGSATASGIGSSSPDGRVIRGGSATASGIGSSSPDGRVIRGGSATATGSGSIIAAGSVLRAGAATATGIGSIIAAGTTVPRQPPLAIHSATRTITPVDQATRTITPVDQATLTLGGIDEATRGARRN